MRDAANALVASTVAYNATSKIATLTPSAALLATSVYTATVQGWRDRHDGERSGGYRLAANRTWSFTTAAVVDTTPPTVTALSPASGATVVATTATVSATFSEAMDASTVSSATFELRDAANALVASTIGYDPAGRIATLVPTASLANSATYTATVKGGATDPTAKDLAGQPIGGQSKLDLHDDRRARHHAAHRHDACARQRRDRRGDERVGVREPSAKRSTQRPWVHPTFELRDPSNALIAATVSYNGTTGIATLVPGSALAASTKYTATVKGGAVDPTVKDVAGNRLGRQQRLVIHDRCRVESDAGDRVAVDGHADGAQRRRHRLRQPRREVQIRRRRLRDRRSLLQGNGQHRHPRRDLMEQHGQQLATATFTGETASGWQQVSFDTPMAITANTVYVASYLAPKGRYSDDTLYFATTGVDRAPAARAGRWREWWQWRVCVLDCECLPEFDIPIDELLGRCRVHAVARPTPHRRPWPRRCLPPARRPCRERRTSRPHSARP